MPVLSIDRGITVAAPIQVGLNPTMLLSQEKFVVDNTGVNLRGYPTISYRSCLKSSFSSPTSPSRQSAPQALGTLPVQPLPAAA